MTLRLMPIVLTAALIGCSGPHKRSGGVDHVTVPLVVEGNRPYVEVTLHQTLYLSTP